MNVQVSGPLMDVALAQEAASIAAKVAPDEAKVVAIFAAKSKKKKAKTEKKVLAFTIDDKEYYVPERVRPSVSINYLDLMRKQGSDTASSWAVEAVLGEEAYQALLDYEDLEPEEWKAVCAFVAKKLVGEEEDEDPKLDGSSD